MKRLLIACGAAALLASSGGVALASGDPENPAAAPALSDVAALAPAVFKCDGEASINLRTRSVNDAFTFNSTTDVAVPGAQLLIHGPTRGLDTVVVTFTAESRLFGSTGNDWMGIEAKKDGVNIQPVGNFNEMAFTGSDSYDSHAAQWCTTIGPGLHRLAVFTNVTNAARTGWLDDYQVTFTRYQ